MPEGFLIVKSLPTDPENSVTYFAQASASLQMVQVYPISQAQAMAFDNDQQIIDGIHRCLADNQGLLKVEHGTTHHGNSYVYSIVKTLQERPVKQHALDLHVKQYTLDLHIKKSEQTICVMGFFSERGVTGGRESFAFNHCIENNEIQIDFDKDKDIVGWSEDPYDANYTKGIPMDLSEREIYDEIFPEHCLSQLRLFVSKILEIN